MNIKANATNPVIWMHGFFILVFGVIAYFLCWVVLLIVVIQFVTKLITGELNKRLKLFSEHLTIYLMQIVCYITLQSETRPFPFSSFPSDKTGNNLSAVMNGSPTPPVPGLGHKKPRRKKTVKKTADS